MVLTPSLRSFAVTLLVSVAPLGADASEDKRFSATIVPDPGTQTTTVRVRIPKTAHAAPVRSVHLQRASKTGLDLNVPVSFSEVPDGTSIYLMLPTSWTKQAILRVTHQAAETGSRSSGVPGGESYEIPLDASTVPKK